MTAQQINLYFSHEVEQLAAQLSRQLQLERTQSSNPLRPATVIVPNANMQRFLQLHMAASTGISANLEFPFLENGLSQYLNLLEPHAAPVMWTQSDLAIQLFVLMSDSGIMQHPDLQPIQRYLQQPENAALQSRKRWQLANRLAVLFISYDFQRPEMVVQWLDQKLQFKHSSDPYLPAMEQAQMHLYQHLFGGRAEPAGRSLIQRFRAVDWAQSFELNSSMHLFTPTRLSAFHRHLLAHLARHLPVHIYQLNVCCEYWEDMTTEGEDRWLNNVRAAEIKVHDQAGARLAEPMDETTNQAELYFEMGDDMTENPLLKAWAKPGRESLRLFSQLEDDAIHLNVAFNPDWLITPRSPERHALHIIQDTVLQRLPAEPVLSCIDQLASLQLARAPSIHREVEAVYHSVLTQLQQQPELQLTDVAILVTDMDAYRPVIEQVFAEQNSQLPVQLPYSLIDSSAQNNSRYAQAVLALLDLLAHDFLRADVLRWLANDCVQQALGLTGDQLADWLQWCSQLGIYSGFDHLYETRDSGADGPAAMSALSRRFTWQQGLQRMRLSLVSEETAWHFQDVESLGQLAWIIEGLAHWQRQLQAPKSVQAWHAMLSQLLGSYVAVPPDHPAEEAVQLSLFGALDQLLLHAADTTMDFTDLRVYLEQALVDLTANKGSYLSGGLVCAALQPMRPIPFKVIHVLGLDERSFPGEVFKDALDLTQRSRRLGDINTTENMNYLFLETLMCTREKLCLSYVAQDLIKDETILPSSTWQQLHEYASSLLDTQALGLKSYPVTTIPLDRVATSAQAPDPVDAGWLTNHSPLDHQTAVRSHQYKHSGGQKHDQAAVAEDHQSSIPSDETTDWQVSDLVRLLENPLLSYVEQMGASKQLIDDELNTEHEPFALDGLSRHRLFEASMATYLADLQQADAPSLESVLRQQYEQLANQSQLPIALFADLQTFKLQDHDSFPELIKALAKLEPLNGPVVFGDAWHDLAAANQLSATSLEVNGHIHQLHGSWAGLYADDGVLCHQVVVSSSVYKTWHKALIKPFLCWCQAQLDDTLTVAENFQLSVVFRDQIKTITLRRWSTGEVSFSSDSQIRAYLAGLLSGLMEPQTVNLPFDSLHSLTVPISERPQQIPYLKASSKAKTVHALALDPELLEAGDWTQIQDTYQSKAEAWIEEKGYFEMLKAIDWEYAPNALTTYRQRLLPLHVMAGAEGL
ncbi:exodeoxyribonuclease V subunit gamma [Marinicella meishanensis]|uniref:exodeoxyribonuclease V subunit gamma n=1 Tax=Marinicella meishanensis TaxID=2873263 RepID=UPI001CBD218D|nr:exodeoxyribonuclease V subunit gamma [Marinicella sp. NBU2979]